MTTHVIGASGRSGAALCRALTADGVRFVPVVRDAGRWSATGIGGVPAMADLRHSRDLAEALSAATTIVSCAHARHAPAILAAGVSCQRFVFLGSTRKFTRWPDHHALGVLAGEAAFMQSGRPGVMLHPTMIYGAQGEDNVRRLARLLRRLPVVPLPGGGRALVRPIHQGDVTRALRAAIDIAWQGPQAVVVAGADAVSYADFVRAVAAAALLRPPRIASVPGGLLRGLAPFSRLAPGLPTIRAAEIRRLLEDKSFDIAPMKQALGFSPIGLERGLALTFGPASG